MLNLFLSPWAIRWVKSRACDLVTELASLPASIWILVSSAASQYFESIMDINWFGS